MKIGALGAGLHEYLLSMDADERREALEIFTLAVVVSDWVTMRDAEEDGDHDAFELECDACFALAMLCELLGEQFNNAAQEFNHAVYLVDSMCLGDEQQEMAHRRY